MAYGVTNPPDDWVQEQADHTENKTSHGSLPQNQLTNHEATCRRFGPQVNGNLSLYRAKPSFFTAGDSHSARAFFYPLVTSGSTHYMQFGLVGRMQSGDQTNLYAVFLDRRNGRISFGQDLNLGNNYSLNERIAYVNKTININDWYGLRMDLIHEDQDVHIKIYSAMGHAICDNLNADGEPVWTLELDLIHLSGSVVPQIIIGTSGGDNFLSSTPLQNGAMGFCISSGNVNASSAYCVIDSFRTSKI